MADEYGIEGLNWGSIGYGRVELNKIPNDKRSVDAFAAFQNGDVLPPHEYILNSHKVTLREVSCYMISKNAANYPEATLLERYRREKGDPSAN